ncbi:ribbon-helix-helix protein, CopG family [Ligaoa zhengdingensis]|nr:ribbon-helix-helix protein, CopG family [Ligaoa zhengdingensis]
MGRPTDSPKTTMFRVRLDDESLEKLNEAADALNISKSEVVRKGIDSVHQSLKK